MPHLPHDSKDEVAPILAKLFPHLDADGLRVIHKRFVVLFGFLHDQWVAERRHEQDRTLDGEVECASLNGKV
ncbi:hypothetical protein RAMLITH_13630 [Ramlibacter sp. RBP-2]|uniref:Uncharacterized protein n=1 Tax=Ramlibacter lithotrophicus TaxID=2606681 RepID=A0A7X6I730_9BURK|nr:hypothetical protein [Ramlibacter lithotrophicus]NKE66865.1 hypothetical protein [Ramlibacter lithotrophicus]